MIFRWYTWWLRSTWEVHPSEEEFPSPPSKTCRRFLKMDVYFCVWVLEPVKDIEGKCIPCKIFKICWYLWKDTVLISFRHVSPWDDERQTGESIHDVSLAEYSKYIDIYGYTHFCRVVCMCLDLCATSMRSVWSVYTTVQKNQLTFISVIFIVHTPSSRIPYRWLKLCGHVLLISICDMI